MASIVTYGSNFTADTDRTASENIWKTMPKELVTDPSKGVYFFKDVFPLIANNVSSSWRGDLQVYSDSTAGSDIIDANIVGGGVTLETTTDNEGTAIASLPMFKISSGLGRLWFEARVKVLNITDSRFNVFCGLFETGTLSNALPLTTSDAMADKNFVGFQRVFADGDQFDTTYKADSVTQVTVQADAVTVVADTFVKLGMYFDGTTLSFYKDGQVLSGTKTIPNATGTDFPADVALGFMYGIMSGNGADASCSIDWVRIAQEA